MIHRTNILIARIVWLISICWFSTGISIAQDISEVKISGRFRGLPVTVLLDSVQRQQGVRFFYQPSWIDTVSVPRDYDNTPLVQVLNGIFQPREMVWRTFQSDGVVIFPVPAADRQRYIDEWQRLVIGDPLNEGRYSSAVLEGRLVDGKTGDPLPGAVIVDVRTNKGASSDSRGHFILELPTGDHTLQLSYLGYQPVSRKIRLIENGYAEFEIFEETHHIAEVTITGDMADLPRSQMSLIRMETRKIRDLPALMGEVDVMRGLTMQAGVQSVGELSSGFNVRGGNTDQNLLLINGSPVFNTSHLFGFLSLINPDLVDNVRLFKGGMPARYGERVASIMEVDLKDGNEETLRLSGGLGIINSRLAVNGPVSKNKKLTLTTGARSSYSNWILKRVPNPEVSQSITSFYDVAGKLTYKFNNHHRMSGMVYQSHDEYSTSAQTVMRYGSLLGNLQSRNQLTSRLSGEGSAAFSRYQYRLTDLAAGNEEEAYYLSNRLQYGSVKYNLRFRPGDTQTYEAGVNLIGYLIDPGKVTGKALNSLITATQLNRERAVEWAVYFSGDLLVTPEFSVSPGIRMSNFSNIGTPLVYLYDPGQPESPGSVVDSLTFGRGEASKTYRHIEPRLLFRYALTPVSILKLNFQRISQYLFQVSNNAVIAPADTWKAAGYHLPPLVSDQAALGFETASLKHSLEFSVEAYYKKLKNLLEYRNGATLLMNPHLETSLVPANGYSWGVEFQGRKTTGRLTGWFSYTWSRSMRRTATPWQEEQLWSGDYFPSEYDRPHDLSMVGTYNISRRWRFTANFVYLSGRPVTLPERVYNYAGETLIYYSDRNKYRMPAYHRLDMALTLDENLRVKRMWKGSWTLSVYNAYGRHNPYSVYYRKTVPTVENNYRLYSLFQLSVIGIPVPSLTYNFTF